MMIAAPIARNLQLWTVHKRSLIEQAFANMSFVFLSFFISTCTQYNGQPICRTGQSVP